MRPSLCTLKVTLRIIAHRMKPVNVQTTIKNKPLSSPILRGNSRCLPLLNAPAAAQLLPI